MNDILLMMVIPFIVACILLVVKNDRARGPISYIGAALIIATSIWVAWNYHGDPRTFEVSDESIDLLMFAIEAILGLVIIYLGIKHRKPIASVLGLVQLVMSVCFEFVFKEGIEVEDGLYIDDLSIVMILIIGIIGYFTIPTVAEWVVQAGGGSGTGGVNRAASFGAGVAGGAAGSLIGKTFSRGNGEGGSTPNGQNLATPTNP